MYPLVLLLYFLRICVSPMMYSYTQVFVDSCRKNLNKRVRKLITDPITNALEKLTKVCVRTSVAWSHCTCVPRLLFFSCILIECILLNHTYSRMHLLSCVVLCHCVPTTDDRGSIRQAHKRNAVDKHQEATRQWQEGQYNCRQQEE